MRSLPHGWSLYTNVPCSFVVEVMGRDCGYLALLTGLATGADWVLLPESPPPKGWEEKMVNELDKGREMGRRCSLVIISEGTVTLGHSNLL